MFCLRGRSLYLKMQSERASEKWLEALNRVTFDPPEKVRSQGQKAHKLTQNEKKNLLFSLNEHGRFDPVEPLPEHELPDFLFLWNYLHESLRGSSKDNLNSLASILDIDKNAAKMLDSFSVKRQILAINTLGNLHDQRSYDKIEKLAFSNDPIVSIWAWRALFRIDFDQTLEKHLRLIAVREDWSPTFVVKVLLELDKDLISEPLVEVVRKAYDQKIGERPLSRVISYLTIIHVSSFASLIHKILLESDETEVIIACLRIVNSGESLPRIRELLRSERWEIRLQVVQTLGRLGHAEDIKRIISALNDLDWWVRYRSAMALMSMPSIGESEIEKLSQTLPNEFARDILQQVLAEKRLLCYTRPSSLILSR